MIKTMFLLIQVIPFITFENVICVEENGFRLRRDLNLTLTENTRGIAITDVNGDGEYDVIVAV